MKFNKDWGIGYLIALILGIFIPFFYAVATDGVYTALISFQGLFKIEFMLIFLMFSALFLTNKFGEYICKDI